MNARTPDQRAEAQNLVIVMSDEHCAKYLGCYGHEIVKTPNFDRLAREGTRFTNAYTNAPICMPARTAFATGQFPHQTGHWCNATPYDGTPRSWAHALRDAGISASSIGKLHYRDGDVDGGFAETFNPMHALKGIGDLVGAIRDVRPLPPRRGSKAVADEIGPGESVYTRYDREITEQALTWLADAARSKPEPWVLQVGFVAPHFPLVAPEAFFSLYDPAAMALPKACRPEDWPDHPWFTEFRKAYITDSFFDDDRRRLATAAYFALCSFVDHNFGRILDCLDETGLSANTRVVYLSDHGDNLGVRGLWQKSNFYEESAGIPLIVRGAGVPENAVVSTPVSLVDAYPTVLDAVGLASDAAGAGRSLLSLAVEPDDPARTVLGEYHGAGAVSAAFMLRRDRYKYVHYVGFRPQLFDLEADPEELRDLWNDPDHAATIAEFEADLRTRLDPEAVDARAKADQAALVAAFGGAEAVLTRGTFGATPPPGVEPVMM